MPGPLRTIVINLTRDPPISGWGGFDEWTLENLTSEQQNKLADQIDKVCKGIVGHECWTGVN